MGRGFDQPKFPGERSHEGIDHLDRTALYGVGLCEVRRELSCTHGRHGGSTGLVVSPLRPEDGAHPVELGLVDLLVPEEADCLLAALPHGDAVLDGDRPEGARKGSFDPRFTRMADPRRGQLRENRRQPGDADPPSALTLLKDEQGGAPLLEGG
ncbi:hypothetical protein ABZV65_06770 [Streptomyces bauhiniae]|uniref:hypothetical protein n=1 Tax=Streptomyces bauhiniae TaxID=2340725 RepID=UPI0033A56745